jgi:hypothetical protein
MQKDDRNTYPKLPEAMRKNGDTTVVFDHAVASILRILAKEHPKRFSEAIDAILPHWTDTHSIFEVFDLTFEPWTVPSLSEVAAMAKELRLQGCFDRFTYWHKLQPPNYDPNYSGPRHLYRRKAFFSGASMAIRFMNRISEHQRHTIRKIIIDEDRPAVARALCHPMGLIPFCTKYPKLHIEHRWNLWATLLLGNWEPELLSFAIQFEFTPMMLQEWAGPGPYSSPDLETEVYTYRFTSAFSHRVMHIMDAVKSGMPTGSYSAVLDGDPDLNHSTHAFHHIMEREVAWLTLNTDCVATGLFAPPGHRDYPFITRASNEGVAPVGDRSSLIQCNFTLDQPWNFEKLLNEYSVARQPTSSYSPYSPREPNDSFRVTTDILNLKHLEGSMFERKRLPEEIEATERNHEENELLQEGRETSQG